MKKYIKKIFSLFLLAIICIAPLGGAALFAEHNRFCQSQFEVPVSQNHELIGYYHAPSHYKKTFPIAVIIQGSDKGSVHRLYSEFYPKFDKMKIGVVCLEKAGVIAPGEINDRIYNYNDCFETRFGDHVDLISRMKQGLFPNWNGKLIIMGGSEGGEIAAALAAKYQKETQATILFATGGGMQVADEMKKALCDSLATSETTSIEKKEIAKDINDQFIVMRKNPTPYVNWGGHTYKWWASHMRKHVLDDILQIKSPIYLVHGDEDKNIPVESADLVFQVFKKRGKTNLTYMRYDHVGHNLRENKIGILDQSLVWLKNILDNKHMA